MTDQEQPSGTARLHLWLALGALAASGVVLRALELSLAAIPGDPTFSGSVLTGLDFTPWTHDIDEALKVWRKGDPRSSSWIALHVLVDLAVFAPAYCWLLYKLLRQVGAAKRPSRLVVSALYGIDFVETATTGITVHYTLPHTGVIPWLSLTKWFALTAVVVAIFSCWTKGSSGLRRASRGV